MLSTNLEHYPINSIHPGAVKTNLGMTEANTPLLKMLVKIMQCFFITPQQAAAFPILLATSPDFESVHGQYFSKGKAIKASALCYNQPFAKKLWEISARLITGL